MTKGETLHEKCMRGRQEDRQEKEGGKTGKPKDDNKGWTQEKRKERQIRKRRQGN